MPAGHLGQQAGLHLPISVCNAPQIPISFCTMLDWAVLATLCQMCSMVMHGLQTCTVCCLGEVASDRPMHTALPCCMSHPRRQPGA